MKLVAGSKIKLENQSTKNQFSPKEVLKKTNFVQSVLKRRPSL
jgi:hypothetical protein